MILLFSHLNSGADWHNGSYVHMGHVYVNPVVLGLLSGPLHTFFARTKYLNVIKLLIGKSVKWFTKILALDIT